MAERRARLTAPRVLLARARAVTCAIVLLLGSAMLLPSLAVAAQVASAQLSTTGEFTRIVLETNAPVPFKVFTLTDPARLVLDLEDAHGATVLDSLAGQLSPNDGRVRSVRVGRFKPGVIRLVFELKTDVQPHSHPWKPTGTNGYRLALDIRQAVPVDPVMALLAPPPTSAEGATPTPAPSMGKPAADSPVPPPASVAKPPVEPAPAPVTARKPAPSEHASPDKPTSTPVKFPSAPTIDPGRLDDVERLVTVAIDAGHGGEDPGARGLNGTYEKTVTLAIARRLKAILDNQPNMRGVLTRDGDAFIPLHHRVVKARNVQADLFVSIHADAYIRPNAKGSSVFALSDRGATSAAARWLARRENEADLIGGVNLDVPDPNLKRVLLDLSQTATINDSLKLGRIVLNELSTVNTLHKARVEQAGFAVLKAPDIPSILVETAFISNPAEEERLTDDDYQTQLAGAIATGIRRYFAKNPPLARARLARSDMPMDSARPPAVADTIEGAAVSLRLATFDTTLPELRGPTSRGEGGALKREPATRVRDAQRSSEIRARTTARSAKSASPSRSPRRVVPASLHTAVRARTAHLR